MDNPVQKSPLNRLLLAEIVWSVVKSIKLLSTYDLFTILFGDTGVVLVLQFIKLQFIKDVILAFEKVALVLLILSASILFNPSNDCVKL